MPERDRYIAAGIEAEFEPGSRNRVLRNLLGIGSVRAMKAAETEALLEAANRAIEVFSIDHTFTAQDLRHLHGSWLEGIYGWAGEYRTVNVAKGGGPGNPGRRDPCGARAAELHRSDSGCGRAGLRADDDALRPDYFAFFGEC